MSGNSCILLVSKDSNLSKKIEKLLGINQESLFELDVIYPVDKAISLIDNSDYALVIIDIPEEEQCIDAVEKLCTLEADTPIIVLAHSESSDAVQIMKKGAQYVFSKSEIDNGMFAHKINYSINRKRIENALKLKDQILQAVNYAAEIFLSQSNWESWIVEVLARLGQASQTDRVYILRNNINISGEITSDLHAEWIREGIQPNTEFLTSFNSGNKGSKYLRWVKILSDGKIIHENVDSLPQTEQPLLLKIGVRSIIAIPIFSGHSWWGIIGFDQCQQKKTWSNVEIDALKTAANIFGAAISRQEAEEKLTQLATHDYLTGLPNRMLFEDRFFQTAARSERRGEKIVVISIDLDKFKVVNDTNGHPFGDKILIETGKRFCAALRGSDTCARIGGDEFGVIAEGIHNKADALRVLEKLALALKDPIDIDNKEIKISASMGAALYPDIGKNLEGLLNAADKALYQVKEEHSIFKIFKNEQYTLLKE